MQVRKVLVIGAGTMGHGIAQVAAGCGLTTYLHDVSEAAIATGLKAIDANLRKGVEKGKVQPEDRKATLAFLSAAPELESAAVDADLIVEAAPEKLELKQSLFRRVSAVASPTTLLASNTSSLSINRIADACVNPGRVLGMHFFNPVHLMSLLEIVHGERTEPAAVETALETAKRMGKEPIVVRDTPGFASSRLGVVIGLEAMRMLEQGVASAEDIDKAMTLGYRHPMGPLRLTDLVGLDVRLAIAEYLHRELGSEAFEVPQILRRLVTEGRLGKKTGHGFYRWD